MTEHTACGSRGSPNTGWGHVPKPVLSQGDPSSSLSHGQLLGKARNGPPNFLKQGHLGCQRGCLGLPTPSAPQAQAAGQQLVRARRPKGAGWAMAGPLSNLGSLSARPRHTPQHDTPAVTRERDWAFSTFFPLPRVTRSHHNPLHVLGSRPKKENSARSSGCFFSRPWIPCLEIHTQTHTHTCTPHARCAALCTKKLSSSACYKGVDTGKDAQCKTLWKIVFNERTIK